ncbi:MAG: T9SS type A sorting domain-containing protein [Flavobacteriales bacterium]|nr:T9SS type A sorting domain-containing protein [Flavobacteriales bacterium]
MKTTTTLLSLLFAASTSAQTWSNALEIPDHRGTGGSIGLWNSMVIVNGTPAIATLDETHRMIRFVRAADAAGTTWGVPVMVNAPALDGSHLTLAVVNGRPAIAYQSFPGNDLMYVRALDANGDTWAAPVVVEEGSDVGKAASLAVVNGQPAIAYYNASTNRLTYCRALDADGESWGTPVNPELLVGFVIRTELKVVNGNPAIAVGRGGTTRYIRAADANGTAWNTGFTIATGVNNGVYPSLAVVGGVPCMAYYRADDDRVSFRRANDANGDSWAADVTVHDVNGQDFGAYARIFEVEGSPAVAYHNVTNGDLYYVRAANANGSSWTNHVMVDAPGIVGREISVAVVDGAPAVAYQDVTTRDLKFVRASNSTGMGANAWNAPVIIDTHPALGRHVSQTIVDGHPALAYYDASNKDLRYLRALDSAGTQWGTSITVDSLGACGEYCSMTIVNGRPAIAYFDEQDNVRYVRADDALGSSWGSSVGMDDSQSQPRGQGIALKVIAGRPAVAYQNNTNSNVRYVRANDVDGATWPQNGTTVGSSGALNITVALMELNGLPAVAFNQIATGDLLFVVGNNADFSAGALVSTTADATGNVGRFATMALVNGLPAIAYWDETNDALKFVRATTANGSAWGTPVQVDAVGGRFGSLASVDGVPAIAYQGAGDLRYAKASDANGSGWTVTSDLGAPSHAIQYPSLVANGTHTGIAYHDLRREQPWFLSGYTCTDPLDVNVTADANILSAAPGLDYQWLDCLNAFTPIAGATEQTYAANTGSYAVRVNVGACADTSACVPVILTSIDGPTNSRMRIAPNPATDVLSIELPSGQMITRIGLRDALGRLVLDRNVAATRRMELEVASFTSGAYVVEVRDAMGSFWMSRVLLEH